MDAYEFTRFDADRTHLLKAKAYDVETIAFMIDINSKGEDLRKGEKYKEAEHVFLECTMSCTKDEAIGWMKYFMLNAIAYGYTKDLDWRIFFLAAYDIHASLLKGESI